MFVDTFIRRPILATVCSLVIILAGALAIPSMPIAQFPNVAPPTVQKSATNFVLAAGAYSEQGEYDSLFISNYIDVYIKDALKRVPGVADVVIFGERKYSMRIWLDPVRLAARQLTAGDVVNALH